MPDHRQQLTNFLNGLIQQGVPVAEVDRIRETLMANDKVVTYISGGTLAQNLLDQRMQEARTLEEGLRRQQNEWNQYISRATETVKESEQRALAEATARASAETALKAIATQYNIPESELAAMYNFQQSPQNRIQQPTQSQQFQQPTQQQPQQQNTVTREDLLGVINDLALRDSINARHFALTGKPWDSSRALAYMTQQAQVGQRVELEQAWRITENIDSVEAAAAQAAKEAERAQIRLEIQQELASQNTTTPLDAQPQFHEAHLSSIMNPTAPVEGQQAEATGHRARTNAAVAALNRVQQARRLGQPSPYEQANNNGSS